MFHVITGNQLELHASLLQRMVQTTGQNVLTPEWVLIPHRGMQHWLSMELAQQGAKSICMNIDFQLPVSAAWRLVKLILGEESLPDLSAWSREHILWKLYQILAEPELVASEVMAEPTAYWQDPNPAKQSLKRYQLAEQLADLFEQYLIYRPDWVENWQQHAGDWQALLWQYLIKRQGQNPVELIRQAMRLCSQPARPLPHRLFLFGLNHLPPLWLDFFKSLSDQAGMNIHLYNLSPSAEHWDETADVYSGDSNAPHPLLASLGGQGRQFHNLLLDRSDTETPLVGTDKPANQLQYWQHLISGQLQSGQLPDHNQDDSIRLVSAHSALREVQALHDWLLGQFNQNPDLKPRDILVMCPNIEHYAPYVDAVFARGDHHLSDRLPPLPCSIADRSLPDADPTIHTFLSLLELPDSRFSVSQVMTWLNVPVIREVFGLQAGDLDTIQSWLQQANIHWGLNSEHKKRMSGASSASGYYTWEDGFRKLLLGFAWGDEETLEGDFYLIPPVEGQAALLLEKLMRFVDHLQSLNAAFAKDRSVADWVTLLRQEVLETLFSEAMDSPACQSLDNTLTQLLERVADDQLQVPGLVIFDYLKQQLCRPESTQNQYLMGQITFCSLIPMRSVPFRIVAVLGLNDGEFPRQRQAMSFDLMAKEPPRQGDRSRRGDDRFLFLETLFSAREKLYLSFQGRSIKDNSERQPSLILQEVITDLKQHFGFNPDQHVIHVPMQPFSARAYADLRSFDPIWPGIMARTAPRISSLEKIADPVIPEQISTSMLVRFFEHASAYFCQYQLGLRLHQYDDGLDDSEPFDSDHLQRYQVQQRLINSQLAGFSTERELDMVRSSGQMAESLLAEETLTEWAEQCETFVVQASAVLGLDQLRTETLEWQAAEPVLQQDELTNVNTTVLGKVQVNSDDELVYYRLASFKDKDLLKMCIDQMLAIVCWGKPVVSKGLFRGKNGFDLVELKMGTDAGQLLSTWLARFFTGQYQPLLINARIPMECWLAPKKTPEQIVTNCWRGTYVSTGMAEDPYIRKFWTEQPDFNEFSPLFELFQPVFECLTIAGMEVAE